MTCEGWVEQDCRYMRKERAKVGERLYALRQVEKIYGEGEGRVAALQDVNLDIMAGELLAVIGASGSGKSTLLHLLGGMDLPTRGEILFQGKDIVRYGRGKQARFRNQNIGFVFQNFKLLEELTARENILLPPLIGRKKPNLRHYQNVIAQMGLEDRQEHLPGEMSGGQRQRVAIARALMNEPEVLLCDEPTGNLDQKTGKEIMDVLKKVNRQGTTVIMVTHDLVLAEQCDRRIQISDGRIKKAFT